MAKTEDKEGLDIAGFGKIARAIPPDVYARTSKTLVTTFEKLVAPVTETTSGLGRYLRQKFDNMVVAEKAIATYTLEKAVARAKAKAETRHGSLHAPSHLKSYIKTIEESSKETDPLLHEMWANLLASQMIDDEFHPHFVEILPHFSPNEAHILISLLPRTEVGKDIDSFLFFSFDVSFESWIRKMGDSDLKPWTLSCVLLCEFQLADVLAPKDAAYKDNVAILYRTKMGQAFLAAVTP